MTREEVDACLRILAAIASADGSMSSDESRALALLAGSRSERRAELAQGTRVDLHREARRIEDLEARRATFEAALAIAQIDAVCTAEEHAMLVELRNALQLDDVVDVRAAEATWGRQMAEPRRALAEADRAFLHAIARERDRGALSGEKYAAMVEDLRREHARVLADVLPHLPQN